MSNRIQIDSVIDDDDEFWYEGAPYSVCSGWCANSSSPLCIEEFDLSDKNFKPCPCGYQVRTEISRNTVANVSIPPVSGVFDANNSLISRDTDMSVLLQ